MSLNQGVIELMLESFTLSAFSPLLHQSFTAHFSPTQTVTLELIQARDLSASPPQPADAVRPRPPFALEFRGPLEIKLPQHTYRFEHPVLGAFELFIVPIQENQEGRIYEAIFT